MLLDQAIRIFSQDKYNQPHLARAKYQQSKLLLLQNNQVAARSLLEESARLRHKYVDSDLRPAEELQGLDFEDGILFWLR